MIRDPGLLVCPDDLHALQWPEAQCSKCGLSYCRGSVPDLLTSAGQSNLYDFRERCDHVEQDKHDFEAHSRVIKGLLAFEKRRLAEVGYADIRAGIERELKTHSVQDCLYPGLSLSNWKEPLHAIFALPHKTIVLMTLATG